MARDDLGIVPEVGDEVEPFRVTGEQYGRGDVTRPELEVVLTVLARILIAAGH